MKKYLFLIVMHSVSILVSFSQSTNQFYQPRLDNKFYLNIEKIINSIALGQEIVLPVSDKPLIFYPRSNFTNELALKYPQITSYVSHGSPIVYMDIFENEITLFKLTEHGAQHMIADNKNNQIYSLIETNSADAQKLVGQNFCKVISESKANNLSISERKKIAEKVVLKTYRMAVSLTAEFSRSLGVSKDQILAGLNSHMTRINAIYNKENAIEFRLVAKNDTILFTDATNDPFTNGNPSALMQENVTVLNNFIGLQNYDIGHVFGTNTGGVAQLASVCTANKGAGSSSTFGAYNGIDFYMIPCHEIGHQFSAEHTFNLCDNSNETSGSAFEPGSGSTIMSYAGASDCDSNYVQDMMDPYFHIHSLNQIKSYSRQSIGNLCASNVEPLNNIPEVSILSPNNVIIPILTPFEIEGKAFDDKSQELKYNWEEMDLGIKSILGSPQGNAPLFRSVSPTNTPLRSFPELKNILSSTSSKTEVLPNRTRPINLRLTARDQDSMAGAFGYAEYSINSLASAGPFKITNLNLRDTLYKNDFVQIKWDVSNTNKSPINCNTVDIYWSNNGGQNFTKILNTNNDGNEWIPVPNNITSSGRIKIKASNSIFFDINDANLVVINQLNKKITLAPSPSSISLCENSISTLVIKSGESVSNDTLEIIPPLSNDYLVILNKSWITQNDSATISISNKTPNNTTTNLILNTINRQTGDSLKIDIQIQSISNSIKKLLPLHGESASATLPLFKWEQTLSSNIFVIEISESPLFETITHSKIIGSTDSSFTPESELKANAIYFWRIRSNNNCNTTYIPFSTFHTQSLECKTYLPTDLPKFISATGTPRATSTIAVPDNISLAKISLPILKGAHDFVGDLAVSLKAPSGDSINLWTNECNNLSNFNLGLDDQAPIAIVCPLTDRKSHMPKQLFSNLNKSKSNGNWILSVQDTKSGSGGSLDEWNLQLCGSITLPGPLKNKNNTIELLEQRSITVSKNNLEYLDTDSNESQLKYTLLQSPTLGKLLFNNQDSIKAGNQFLQQDINNNKINFTSFSVKADMSETLTFLVSDEKNNWSGLQTLEIKVLNDPTIATKDREAPFKLLVYPNPFEKYITVEIFENKIDHLEIHSINGVLLKRKKANSNTVLIDASDLSQGLYLLKVFTTKNTSVQLVKILKS